MARYEREKNGHTEVFVMERRGCAVVKLAGREGSAGRPTLDDKKTDAKAEAHLAALDATKREAGFVLVDPDWGFDQGLAPRQPIWTDATRRQLFDAIAAKRPNEALALLDAFPEHLETVGAHDDYCRDKTPLMFALQCQQFALADALLASGADATARMPGGPELSVLELAVECALMTREPHPADAFNAMVGVARRLVEAGADPSRALLRACVQYHPAFDSTEMITMLLDAGADPAFSPAGNGWSARALVASKPGFPDDLRARIASD